MTAPDPVPVPVSGPLRQSRPTASMITAGLSGLHLALAADALFGRQVVGAWQVVTELTGGTVAWLAVPHLIAAGLLTVGVIGDRRLLHRAGGLLSLAVLFYLAGCFLAAAVLQEGASTAWGPLFAYAAWTARTVAVLPPAPVVTRPSFHQVCAACPLPDLLARAVTRDSAPGTTA